MQADDVFVARPVAVLTGVIERLGGVGAPARAALVAVSSIGVGRRRARGRATLASEAAAVAGPAAPASAKAGGPRHRPPRHWRRKI